jgi:DNA (cytosine-5)-methyltransferase 1
MRYLSVCSGVEAATTAWHDLGWTPVGFSEIEKFPSEVLAHHYPSVPNLGDMTNYKEWNLESVGLLVGGTPCQSFSVAGLRKGLEDPRGNLALTYVGILDKFRPKWCIWENVPGVLSSNGGRDFGSFLGALAELGYGFAYRVLDAQYFGVPQRRRRVFVVGCLGDWEAPAKVLLERESLLRNPAPSRKTGKEVTGITTNRLVAFGEYSNDGTASTLKARDYKDATDLIVYETHPADSRVKAMGDVCQTVTSRWGTGGGNVPLVQSIGFTQCDAARDVGDEVSPTLRSGGNGGYPNHSVAYGFEPGIAKREGNPNRFSLDVSPTLRAQMGDNQVAVAYSIREDAKANNFSATPLEVTPALQALRPSVQSHHAQTFIAQSFGWQNSSSQSMTLDNITPTLDRSKTPAVLTASSDGKNPVIGALCARDYKGVGNQYVSEGKCIVESSMAVRRLTPIECERLQGFPDNYTNIPWRGKPDSPDAPRYKAMGNSMAVPVMRWIGNRIQGLENGLL